MAARKAPDPDYNPEALLLDRKDEPEPPKDGGIPEYIDDPAVNIALVLGGSVDGRLELQKVARVIRKKFDDAWEASKERREQATRAWKYFAGAVPRSWKPHKNSADVNVPIVTENGSRLAWRAFQELFGDFRAVCDVAPNGTSEEELRYAAKRTLFDNWQLCQQFTEFPREMHKAVNLHYIVGDWVCVSEFDVELGRNRHRTLGPDEYVVPWVESSTAPDYSDVPFFCRIRHLYPHQIEANKDSWQGVEVCKNGKPSWSDDPQQELAYAVQSTLGTEPSPSDTGAPRRVLQFEGWLLIPLQEQQRYCKAIVDYATGEVFWLSFLEEEDMADRDRYTQQEQELAAYRAGLMEMNVNPEAQAPTPPSWMDMEEDPEKVRPEPIRRKPLHMRAHGVCIEPIKGPLGIGFGIILMAYNECANSTLDAFLDQMVASTVYSWLTTNKKLADKGESELIMEPGTIRYIPGTSPGQKPSESLERVEPPTPNPQAVQIVQIMRDYGQSAAHASDVMSGRPGKSGESAKGQNERLEQAMAMLSVSAAKFMPTFEQILRNNAKLNSIHLREEQFFQVTRAIPMPMGMGNVGPQTIARKLYAMPYFATMRADARFVSRQQRVAEVDQVMMIVKSDPSLMQNQKLYRRCLIKALETRGLWDVAQMAVEGWMEADKASAAQAQRGIPQQPPQMPPGAPQQRPAGPPGPQPQRPPQPPGPPQAPAGSPPAQQ